MCFVIFPLLFSHTKSVCFKGEFWISLHKISRNIFFGCHWNFCSHWQLLCHHSKQFFVWLIFKALTLMRSFALVDKRDDRRTCTLVWKIEIKILWMCRKEIMVYQSINFSIVWRLMFNITQCCCIFNEHSLISTIFFIDFTNWCFFSWIFSYK